MVGMLYDDGYALTLPLVLLCAAHAGPYHWYRVEVTKLWDTSHQGGSQLGKELDVVACRKDRENTACACRHAWSGS